MNLADLKKPFPPDRISWRVGSTTKDKTKGMALAYIDARDVQDRLDAVCGPENWQNRFPHANGKTVCEIGLWLQRGNEWEWIWKADGAGDSDVEAEKGALSDAFKRAAVKWGVGRYLYDLDSPWVELETYEKNGQTFVKGIKQAEYAKLKKLLEGEKNTDEDVLAGTRNWVDKQKDLLLGFSEMDHLTAWLKKHASYGNREGNWDRPTPSSTLDKLLKFSAPLFNELKSYYMEKMREV
jgi:hypothetical protein